MTTLPLGTEAYNRATASEPEIVLVNRFLEKNPTNLVEHVGLVSRSPTRLLEFFPGDTATDSPRGLFSMIGLFNNDLFCVNGSRLWRYDHVAGTSTQITGVIQGSQKPFVAWDKGTGYERMFFADGTLLQYYGGRSHATGTLTTTVTPTNQVIEIGGIYYSWNANVDALTPDGAGNGAYPPDGSALHPWLANPGADPLAAMVTLLVFGGVSGVDYSTNLSGPSLQVTPAAVGGPPATSLDITSVSTDTLSNNITTSVYSGTGMSWGAATLLGGGIDALQQVIIPTGEGIGALATLNHFVLCAVDGTQKVFYLRPGSTTMGALDFLEKESNPDPVVDMVTVGDVVMVVGEGSTETWYSTGSNTSPIAPIPGRTMARGAVPGTVVNIKEDVFLVGNDRIVYSATGGMQRVSTHGIEERIRKQLRREQGVT